MIANKLHIQGSELVQGDEETLRRILAIVRTRTGHDFTRYKKSTIHRRVARRLQVTKTETLKEYFDHLRQKPEEAHQLFADLLISVTTFFRDPAAFELLRDHVISKLFTRDDPGPLRIWVSGCATGEEAYSIAMLLSDEAAARQVRPEIQIFASDLDATALAIAREGCYPLAIEADVSEERLRRYFTREEGQYRIRREIRDMILFTSHSLLRDPPFSRLDLVSCRNVLIYMERDLQQQVLTTFNYALKPDGYLLLGASESADTAHGLFRTLDRDGRIFQSNFTPERARELPRLLIAPRAGEIPVIEAVGPASGPKHENHHYRALEEAAPPSMLVNDHHHIVNISETAGRFVFPSAGPVRNDVTELVRPELRFDLRAALLKAFERNERSFSLPIPVQFNGHQRRVYIQVNPIKSEDEAQRQALVFFLEGDAIAPEETESFTAGQDQESAEIIRRLKEELELTRSRLRASREEFEGTNEELRAANEELQSINEEYRSTAEELETSKEELQSINEELQTVNAELKVKLDSVSRANNDLQNLMAVTDVGTLFLDTDLRIKRFTPRIAELFNVTPQDEGRSITDFTHQLDYAGFTLDARDVLKNLTSVEREVASNGRWYMTRLRPYRTVDDRIEGVVGTFVDITERLQAQEALKTSEARLRLLLSELSHRVKNTLTVVQSMARQSFREGVPRDAALSSFSDRLSALSVAHDLLVSSDWSGADLRDLVQRQVAPFVGARKDRIHIEGPAVRLTPNTAMRFGLVLHELATNAIKYGALSAVEGTVQFTWTLTGEDVQPIVSMRWVEQGGPPFKKPTKQGFGTFLIESGLPNASVKQSYKPSGFECIFDMPLDSE